MYIVKNALKNISRAKGRNILIGIIVFAIVVSSCVALSIRKSASDRIDEAKANIKISATIGYDIEKAISAQQGSQGSGGPGGQRTMIRAEQLAISDFIKYSESKYVSGFAYTLSASVSKTEGLEPYTDADEEENSTEQPEGNQMRPGGGVMISRMGETGDFSVSGYSMASTMKGEINSVSDGVIFTEGSAEAECLISELLAANNGLKVGDSISVANPNKTEETYSLKIIGIVKQNESEENSMPSFFSAMDPTNKIYMSAEALEKMIESSKTNATTTTDEQGRESTTELRTNHSATYYFSNEEDYNAFSSAVYDMGLSADYKVSSSDIEGYKESIKPLEGLSKIAMVFLLVILIVGGVILVVINIFNIRERKYDVGVLTAIGMKKGKVAIQFICELFVITLAATVIGTAAGAAASVPVASELLKSQVSAVESDTQTQEGPVQGGPATPGGRGQRIGGGNIFQQMGNGTVDYIEDIKASTDLSVLVYIVLIGFGLTLTASSAAIVFVLRYEPLKILSNRA